MNFHDLRIIVGQIKKNVHCPKCTGKYTDEDLEVIGNLGDEHVFFHASCFRCSAQSIINVSMHNTDAMPEHMSLPEFKKLGIAPRMGHISQDEVLDMHNFLKEFDGNFETMFESKPKQP